MEKAHMYKQPFRIIISIIIGIGIINTACMG